MNVSPYTDDLDIASVNAWDELSPLLRTVHLRADKPSLRTLEARSRHGATPLSKTVVSEMLRGTRFPRKAVMLAFLQACGIQDERVEPWLRAWERIAERTAGPQELGTGRANEASPPEDGLRIIASAKTDSAETRSLREQVDQLSADNERLRMRIVAAEATSAREAARPDDEADDHPSHGPLASRRELGVLLRALREEKGITVEQAATRLLCSARKINQMESRFRSGTVRDVRDLCEFYGVTKEADRRHLMQLARNSRQQGWYESYNTDPRWSPYIDFEDDASHIKLYYSAILPGMMQTAEYFRALHQNSPHDFTAERIEQFTEVRLKRQRILTRPDPPRFWAILDEAALRRSVGGPAAMRDQLSHIIEMSTLPNVTLQIIPFRAGAHPAMDTSFTILEFNDPVPAMVYVEGLPGFFYMENPADVAQSQRIFQILRAASLSEEDSVEFINRMIRV